MLLFLLTDSSVTSVHQACNDGAIPETMQDSLLKNFQKGDIKSSDTKRRDGLCNEENTEAGVYG